MTIEEVKKEYPYLYETHLHTNQGSACGRNTGEEMAKACKEFGYTGIIVTDHNWGGNCAVDRSLPWEEWVDKFYEGYRQAKETGDKIGLQVFPGYEAGYGGPEFLIYGLTPEWLKKHPELKGATPAEQLKIVHSGGGIVIQAHPFREAEYIKEVITYPDDVDGAEGINAAHSGSRSLTHTNPLFDERALAYVREHHFPSTAGSDVHTTHMIGGGMAFKTPIKDMKDFCDRVVNGGDYVITNGDHYYTRGGEFIV